MFYFCDYNRLFFIDRAKENHYRKIVPLIAEMLFYSVAIYVIMCAFNVIPVSLKGLIKAMFPMFWGGNWYVIYYVLWYMFIPFINPWIKSMNRKQYTKLLCFVIVIWSIIPTFTMGAWKFGEIDFFIVMYLIGAYIKLHVKDKITYNNKWNLVIGSGAAILMLLSVLVFDLAGCILKTDFFIAKATYFKEYNKILPLICAIFIFLYFANKEFNNKVINIIAGSVVGIYLIHDNEIVRGYIWKVLYPNAEYIDFPYIHAMIKIFGVFGICLIIDLIRSWTIGRLFENWLRKHCNSVVEWFKRIIPQKLKSKLEKL